MGDDPYSLPEREMKDFQFRQMKKIRVFDSPNDLPKERSNLLAISNKYGLTFVGQDRVLKVFFTQDIISAAKAQGNTNEIVENVKSQVVIVDLPIHHIALSSDELTLSVCGASEQSALVLDFYDVRTFFNKVRPEKRPFASFRPGAAVNTSVQDLKWSPVEAFRLAACLSDGSMMVLDVTNSVALFAQLPASVGITCVCWSPKGKQVAAGKQNATVVQYTPNLQEKKVIPCPNFYSADNPVKVLDVLWLSTFNFAVAYAAADGSPETPPELVVVSLPKKDEKKEEKYLNFSDLVYGTCTERQHHYFLYHVEDWDLVLAASAASIEVSIIAKQDDKTNWELWVLEDASRGELPVTLNNDDTLPVGVGIDYTSQGEIHISEEKKLPPAPTLLILSTDGVLCPFSLLNMNPGVQQLVKAAGSLALDGERPPLAKLASAPPPQAPIVSSTPAFFQVPSTTAIVTPAPTLVTMAPGPGSGLMPSSGLSFTLPSLASNAGSVFSFSPASSATSAFPSSSSFSFTTLKPSGDVPSASAFSFSALAAKPSAEGTGALALPLATPAGTQQAATASPVSVPKGHVEPATPNVRINLNDRFLATESPAPPVSLAQPFSLCSTPLTDTNVQVAPPFSISKPAAPTAPHPPQTSTQSVPVQKAAPVPIAPPAATATQALSVKTLEKQLQQKKDSDPVMVGILEEITHFQKEMDELKARSNRADFLVGSSEEMSDLRKESDHLHVFTLEIKETTESLHGDISTLKTTLLEGFAGVEEARSQSELNRSKDYLLLLYKKPLDPRSEQQLKEIRRLYQYVKFAVEDVNDVLDLEWEKHLEKKKKQKHMIVPEREALYTALANNMDIINTQKQKLDQLVRDLQSLRLYNKTSAWSAPSQPTSAPSPGGSLDNELESLRNTLLKSNLEDTPKVPSKSPSKMTPVKQTRLRNFLSKRQTPPVRSTAPANLSRSAFLSPKYFEDLDEVSSTSSLSQTQEPEEFVAVAEEEEEPIPVPTLVPAVSRHPTVVRTSSVQPGFSVQSASFCRVPSGPGSSSSPVVPKINMDSADSTALATKTVKHGAPPTEKTTPTTIPAPQAAGRAALNRQMISQKPVGASLTEFTLKSVPQVVNVQELKAKGPAMPGSTIISSSVPAPAAQVVQQALATMEAKRNSSQATGKISLPVAETLTGPQAFVFGAASKTEAPAASTSTPTPGEQSSKGFSFSTGPPGGFSFCLSSTSSSSPPGATSQAKDVPPVGKFSFGSGTGKMLFSASETPISLTPKPATSALPTSSSAPPPSIGEPTKLLSTAPSFQTPKAQGVAGETLGSFSGLRVGQGDEVKEPPKTSVNFTFGQSGNGVLATGFTFGSSQPKPVAAGNGLDSAGAADSSKSSNSAAAAGIFKPPELVLPSTTKQGFSVITTSSISSTATSFSSLLAAPLPPETTSTSEKPTAVGPSPEPEPSLAVQHEEASSELSPEPPPPSTPSPASVPEETPPSQPAATPVEKPLPQPAPALDVTPTPPPLTSPPAEPTPLAEPSAPTPVTETAPAHTPSPAPLEQPPAIPAAVTAPAVTAAAAPPPATPGSIFAQPVLSTTLSVTSFTPVISTASTAASSASVTPLGPSTTSTTPALVFGQPTSTTSASVFGASSFGATSTTSGFGKPVFGQVTATAGFGQPAPGSAGGFAFGQSSFGGGSGFGQTPVATATAPASSSGGGLFGSASTSSASSFSFGASSTSSGVSTRAGIFGHTSTPAFGQPSTAFGQGCLFGSNTTTTTSSGFGFGQQTTGFGSTPTPSVFGQPPSTASVFGQPSSGGGLFGSGAGNTTSSAGGFFSGLGGKPSEDAANKNPFGTTATGGFGQSSQAGSTSLFGNSGAKAFGFGGSAFGDQKASGTFSAGGGTVATQGFGSFSTPAKTGSFGSAAVFTSPPAFGSSPAFGGSATFGTSPTFNNQMGSAPSKVFGEGTAAASMGGFGFASPPSAPAFGSMAPQSSAPSFGGLAQQAPGFGAQSTGFSSFASSGGFSGFGSTNTNQSSSQTFGGWRS